MNLEKIELKNFKSYRGECLLGPFDRFSSIIGPNGSGKSNILDALIFALNVPIESMRVKHISELVTHGESDCWVRVHLCKCIFERNISASGVVGFRYNGSRISAKDYNSKLEEINIISKIKNFVICQGDVLRTDVDLLQMMEHASGSSTLAGEYKQLESNLIAANKELSAKYERRKQYLSRLKDSEANKEKEASFNRLIAERDALQRRVYLAEICEKEAEMARTESALHELKDSRENGADASGGQISAARAETVKLQKEYYEKESELMYLKSKQKLPSPDANSAVKEELSRLEDERASIEEAIRKSGAHGSAATMADISLQEERLNGISDAIAEKEAYFNSLVQNEEQRLAELTLLNFDKINRANQLRTNRKCINSKISGLINRQSAERAEREEKARRSEAIAREMKELHAKIANREDRYNQILSDEERKNNELASAMREILINKARKSDSTRRSIMADVINNLKGIFTGVHGKVVDLVVPIQKKYELGVSVLLGSYDFAVVVDNESVALNCVRYLKEIKAGKLTFIPLSKMSAVAGEQAAALNRADCRLAKKCVQYDVRYAAVVDYIFRDSLVADSAATARSIMHSGQYTGRVSTLEGTLFTATGLITGGKQVRNTFDANYIDALIERRSAIISELKVIKDRKEAYSEVQAVKDRIALLEKQLETTRMVEHPGISMEQELSSLQQEYARINGELEEFEGGLVEFEDEKRRIKLRIKEAERQVFSQLLDTVGLTTLSEYRHKRDVLAGLKTNLLRLGRVREDIDAIRKEQVDRTERSTNEMDFKAMENELNDLHRRLGISKGKLKQETEQAKRLDEVRSQVDKKILGYELFKAKLEEELKDLRKYFAIECGGDEFSDGSYGSQHGANASLGLSELREMLAEMSRRLDQAIPALNAEDSGAQTKYATANKEYQEAKTRALELKKQFYEVKDARMEAFGNCFSAVSREIAAIYKTLTRTNGMEGHAYLVYEGNPFTNNLRYYLMPPSKRFTEFRDLSGGEKSMAILAFIFALNAFRQAPFYIFDEVDSALDKVNVEKLASYVLSSPNQFVVISLKQQFFQNSDSLTGIYKCPKEGISKVLTYKLK